MNTFGKILTLTTFGESHGPAMGGVLCGMPPRVAISLERIASEMARRRPGGNGPAVSARRETDEVEILSGISPEGLTLGSPIGFIIRNRDARSVDYKGYEGKFRPNHADYTYYQKYGIHDWRGGGRASARETVSWVAAAAIARQWVESEGISFHAEYVAAESLCPASDRDVESVARAGDSIGGVVNCRIDGVPVGLGEPTADKLHARLAQAMMSINAAKAFEYGDGFRSASMLGSESADFFQSTSLSSSSPFSPSALSPADAQSPLPFQSNHSGGIQGGISNGMPIEFKVYFKPTPTIMRPQPSIDINGNPCVIEPRGRHDACVAMRAAPVVEAMAVLVIADFLRIR